MRLRNTVLWIIGINIIMFILQNTITGFTENTLLQSSDVLARPWILLSSMFVHANATHLLFNMYSLFIFGPLVEQRIGSKKFLGIYFIAGIFAAMVAIFFYPKALGASGAIMSIIGLTIMLFPHLRVLLFFIIPMSMRTAGIIFAFIDIAGLFYDSGIANIAHLAGLAVGLLFGYHLAKHTKQPKRPRKINITDSQHISDNDIDNYLKGR